VKAKTNGVLRCRHCLERVRSYYHEPCIEVRLPHFHRSGEYVISSDVSMEPGVYCTPVVEDIYRESSG
jgi:hypothetical protein